MEKEYEVSVSPLTVTLVPGRIIAIMLPNLTVPPILAVTFIVAEDTGISSGAIDEEELDCIDDEDDEVVELELCVLVCIVDVVVCMVEEALEVAVEVVDGCIESRTAATTATTTTTTTAAIIVLVFMLVSIME
ncbi:hypothetical protein GCM10007981_04850 [Thermocladium modestius]|uniref:Uncharacterized protein n=1 Tax=Thermocladium modestius TaxID=62609 RepID=A0A830GV00_9CREN|nr:hypothetical protein GCM10007981_04850 [Thermocladium modestius]